jgi:biopolymer transport protein ExbD
MEMNLPKAVTGERLQKEQILTLHIKKDNQLLLENTPVSLQNLQAVLNEVVKESAGVTLVIKGDAQVPHGKVVEIMDITNASGVKKILITVKKQ